MNNLNLLFNKTYYAKIGQPGFGEDVKRINGQIMNTCFVNETDYIENSFKKQYFILKTLYPGLLAGIGYAHGSGEVEDDINIGFSFDYVSGQPIIPGSSVKGVLRSHFKYHAEAVEEILRVKLKKTGIDVKKLEEDIFEGEDVFFDAVVFDGDSKGRLMGEDYITPHPDDVKNPTPIHIIKVLPEVRFEFRFSLKDSVDIDAEEKKRLFSLMLQYFGVGAKTNIGYGALCEADDVIKPKASEPVSDMVICPVCKKKNYKYSKDGRKQSFCFSCKKPLY